MTLRALTMVVTASEGSFVDLEHALLPLPIKVRRVPLLHFVPPASWDKVDAALARMTTYRAVAVTSPRAAQVVADRMPTRRAMVPLWATGDASAAPLLGRFTLHHVLPRIVRGGRAETLAAAMLEAGVGSPVCFPCGSLRRDALIEGLDRGGLTVDPVLCYHSQPATPQEASAALHGADIVVVASPSVARLLSGAVSRADRPLLVAAGPTTGAEAVRCGWRPDAVAGTMTGASLRDALQQLLGEGQSR